MSNSDDTKRIQELANALESGHYDIPPMPALVTDKVPFFKDALSDKATELSKKKGTIIEPGFVMVQMAALWPIKAWYQETFAHLINNLVADGVVKSIIASGAVAMAGGGDGGVKVDDGDSMYCGPDQYGVIYTILNRHIDGKGVPFISVKELEAKYGEGVFSDNEGEIVARFPNWFNVVNRFPENSLAERLKRAHNG